MSLAEKVERLRSVPLFGGLDDESLALVASLANDYEAPAGRVMVEPKQSGSGMFVIEDGTARAELRGGSTRTLGPGDCFGEIALLRGDGDRTARVRADTDIRCLTIAREDFRHLLEREPRVALALLGVLADRLAN